jgi:5-(carboxyamino)imidazole ribonucleotide synthase
MSSSIILPGKTIGILGGGQLGRMFAIAARRMGYRVHAFDPTPDCPTGQVADLEVNAAYDDVEAAKRFASAVDVVTFEFENVPAGTLAAVEKIRPVRPSPYVLETTRHRLREKDFLSKNGFPVAPYRRIETLEDLRKGVAQLGTPCILKTAEFGYDGKGQVKINAAGEVESAWKQLGGRLGLLEGFIRFEKEISVIGARGFDGVFHYYPTFENEHRNHILDVTTYPAAISERVDSRASHVAIGIAQALDLIGVMCVEMFVVGDDVIVNELAPRPHNSGHLTFDFSVTSQFEQQLRAVCGLPIGSGYITWNGGVAMANLLGDLWQGGEPNWAAAIRDFHVKLHLYGKSKAAAGRKMGHLTAVGATPEEARQRVLAARDALVKRS